MRLLPLKIPGQNSGFTLIEVLIAVIVLSIGILGLIAMETTAITTSQQAYYRSQATVLLYDMADKMRANMEGTYAGVSKVNNSCYNFSYVGSTPSSCTANQLAEKDIFEWEKALDDLLPMGNGAVSVAGSQFDITVRWDNNRDGDTVDNEEILTVTFEL